MQQRQTDLSGAALGTPRSYTVGFILSLVLTTLAFAMVMFGDLTKGAVIAIIIVTAIAQILVQLSFFLHLNFSSEARWNMLALIFAILLMTLFVGGSLWIMYNLNYRMM